MTMEDDPAMTLRGENLTYYRNIQYLKEMTTQATSLLSRSNAVYTNILNDVEVAMKVRGCSESDDYRSFTPDFSCATCGLYHGATFCIVDEIDKEEKLWAQKHKAKFPSTTGPQWKETRIESITKDSDGVEIWRKPFKLDKIVEEKEKTPVKIDEPWPVAIDNRSPEEILTTYEALCTRFGSSSGRRYLLATSLAAETQPWAISCAGKVDEKNLDRLKMKFREKEIDCFPVRPQVSDHLCPQYSGEVRKKLEEVFVEVLPNCQVIEVDKPKRWRDILCRPRRASGNQVQVSDNPDEEIEEPKIIEMVVCKCGAVDCDCGGKRGCSIPPAHKTCGLLYNEGNNYVNTIRSRMERRRLAREHHRKSSMRSSATSNTRQRTVSTRRRSSAQFAHLAYAEALALLDNCIGNELPSNELESLDVYRKKIEELARVASPSSMIPEREWNVWYDNYREARENVDEDSDTMDSDIQSTVTDLSEHSKKSSDLDYKERAMPPSRIPYAAETYNLINRHFDKITLQFNKSVMKNSSKSSMYTYRPTFAYATHKLNMLKSENEVFRETMDNMKQTYFYSKTFTPLTIRRRSKKNRMNVVSTKFKKTWNRRTFIEGIQQGKRLKYCKNTKKYTKEGDYLGFTPQKRELLRMIESRRFTSCDLVGDVTGRKITKQTIYDDYQLLSNLFDEPSPHLRMSLLDEGMKQRMERYKTINRRYGEPTLPEPPECSSVHDFRKSGDLSMIQKKLEKEDIRFVGSLQKNTSPGGMRSEEHEKTSFWSNSPLPSPQMSKNGKNNKNKSYYSLDQTARVSTLHLGTKPVSQNILLGSDNDGQSVPQAGDPDPNRHGPLADVYGSNLKKASLQNSVDARRSSKLAAPSKNKDAASSLAADTRFPPPPPPSLQNRESVSPSNVQTLSSSQRASRNTPTEPRVPSSRGLNIADKGSTSKLPTSRKISPRASTQVGSTVISSQSSKIESKIGLPTTTASSIMGESMVLGKDRVRSQSLIVEPGSKLIPQKGMKSGTISGVISHMREIDEPVGSRTVGQPGESKELKKRSKKDKEQAILSDLSLTKLRGMKAVDRLGPTKKRVFGVDIGQGINYVQYLRDNAAGADEDKKQELFNLLMAPREKKRVAPGKPVCSKTALLTESQQESLNREIERSSETVVTTRKKKMSLDSDVTDSISRLQRNPIKTLDQIYKEVHGINKRNTPADLIENDYEHGMMKKQQLRKHKIL